MLLKQVCVWSEWSDLERALPRANEILCSDFFAVGPTRVLAQMKSPDTPVVRRFPTRRNRGNWRQVFADRSR